MLDIVATHCFTRVSTDDATNIRSQQAPNGVPQFLCFCIGIHRTTSEVHLHVFTNHEGRVAQELEHNEEARRTTDFLTPSPPVSPPKQQARYDKLAHTYRHHGKGPNPLRRTLKVTDDIALSVHHRNSQHAPRPNVNTATSPDHKMFFFPQNGISTVFLYWGTSTSDSPHSPWTIPTHFPQPPYHLLSPSATAIQTPFKELPSQVVASLDYAYSFSGHAANKPHIVHELQEASERDATGSGVHKTAFLQLHNDSKAVDASHRSVYFQRLNLYQGRVWTAEVTAQKPTVDEISKTFKMLTIRLGNIRVCPQFLKCVLLEQFSTPFAFQHTLPYNRKESSTRTRRHRLRLPDPTSKAAGGMFQSVADNSTGSRGKELLNIRDTHVTWFQPGGKNRYIFMTRYYRSDKGSSQQSSASHRITPPLLEAGISPTDALFISLADFRQHYRNQKNGMQLDDDFIKWGEIDAAQEAFCLPLTQILSDVALLRFRESVKGMACPPAQYQEYDLYLESGEPLKRSVDVGVWPVVSPAENNCETDLDVPRTSTTKISCIVVEIVTNAVRSCISLPTDSLTLHWGVASAPTQLHSMLVSVDEPIEPHVTTDAAWEIPTLSSWPSESSAVAISAGRRGALETMFQSGESLMNSRVPEYALLARTRILFLRSQIPHRLFFTITNPSHEFWLKNETGQHFSVAFAYNLRRGIVDRCLVACPVSLSLFNGPVVKNPIRHAEAGDEANEGAADVKCSGCFSNSQAIQKVYQEWAPERRFYNNMPLRAQPFGFILRHLREDIYAAGAAVALKMVKALQTLHSSQNIPTKYCSNTAVCRGIQGLYDVLYFQGQTTKKRAWAFLGDQRVLVSSSCQRRIYGTHIHCDSKNIPITLEYGAFHDEQANVILILAARLPCSCTLHWGLAEPESRNWLLPDKQYWPPGSIAVAGDAVETPFRRSPKESNLWMLEFVLPILPPSKPLIFQDSQTSSVPEVSNVHFAVEDAMHSHTVSSSSNANKSSVCSSFCSNVPQSTSNRVVSESPSMWEELLVRCGFLKKSQIAKQWAVSTDATSPENYEGIRFVLTDSLHRFWVKDRSNEDFFISIGRPCPLFALRERHQRLMEAILTAELYYSAWGDASRYQFLLRILETSNSTKCDEKFWSWVYFWLCSFTPRHHSRFKTRRHHYGDRTLLYSLYNELFFEPTSTHAGRRQNLIQNSRVPERLAFEHSLCHPRKPAHILHLTDQLMGLLTSYWRALESYRPIIRQIIEVVQHPYVMCHCVSQMKAICIKWGLDQQPFFKAWLSRMDKGYLAEDLILWRAVLAFFQSNDIKSFLESLEAYNIHIPSVLGVPTATQLLPIYPFYVVESGVKHFNEGVLWVEIEPLKSEILRPCKPRNHNYNFLFPSSTLCKDPLSSCAQPHEAIPCMNTTTPTNSAVSERPRTGPLASDTCMTISKWARMAELGDQSSSFSGQRDPNPNSHSRNSPERDTGTPNGVKFTDSSRCTPEPCGTHSMHSSSKTKARYRNSLSSFKELDTTKYSWTVPLTPLSRKQDVLSDLEDVVAFFTSLFDTPTLEVAVIIARASSHPDLRNAVTSLTPNLFQLPPLSIVYITSVARYHLLPLLLYCVENRVVQDAMFLDTALQDCQLDAQLMLLDEIKSFLFGESLSDTRTTSLLSCVNCYGQRRILHKRHSQQDSVISAERSSTSESTTRVSDAGIALLHKDTSSDTFTFNQNAFDAFRAAQNPIYLLKQCLGACLEACLATGYSFSVIERIHYDLSAIYSEPRLGDAGASCAYQSVDGVCGQLEFLASYLRQKLSAVANIQKTQFCRGFCFMSDPFPPILHWQTPNVVRSEFYIPSEVPITRDDLFNSRHPRGVLSSAKFNGLAHLSDIRKQAINNPRVFTTYLFLQSIVQQVERVTDSIISWLCSAFSFHSTLLRSVSSSHQNANWSSRAEEILFTSMEDLSAGKESRVWKHLFLRTPLSATLHVVRTLSTILNAVLQLPLPTWSLTTHKIRCRSGTLRFITNSALNEITSEARIDSRSNSEEIWVLESVSLHENTIPSYVAALLYSEPGVVPQLCPLSPLALYARQTGILIAGCLARKLFDLLWGHRDFLEGRKAEACVYASNRSIHLRLLDNTVLLHREGAVTSSTPTIPSMLISPRYSGGLFPSILERVGFVTRVPCYFSYNMAFQPLSTTPSCPETSEPLRLGHQIVAPIPCVTNYEAPTSAVKSLKSDFTWFLGPEEFTQDTVGQMGCNFARLCKSLHSWHRSVSFSRRCMHCVLVNFSGSHYRLGCFLAATVAVPFSALDRALQAPENCEVAKRLLDLDAECSKAGNRRDVFRILSECRRLIQRLLPPSDFRAEYQRIRQLIRFGTRSSQAAILRRVKKGKALAFWHSITQVWGSLYTPSTYVYCRNHGIERSQLRVCVLIQALQSLAKWFYLDSGIEDLTGPYSLTRGTQELFLHDTPMVFERSAASWETSLSFRSDRSKSKASSPTASSIPPAVNQCTGSALATSGEPSQLSLYMNDVHTGSLKSFSDVEHCFVHCDGPPFHGANCRTCHWDGTHYWRLSDVSALKFFSKIYQPQIVKSPCRGKVPGEANSQYLRNDSIDSLPNNLNGVMENSDDYNNCVLYGELYAGLALRPCEVLASGELYDHLQPLSFMALTSSGTDGSLGTTQQPDLLLAQPSPENIAFQRTACLSKVHNIREEEKKERIPEALDVCEEQHLNLWTQRRTTQFTIDSTSIHANNTYEPTAHTPEKPQQSCFVKFNKLGEGHRFSHLPDDPILKSLTSTTLSTSLQGQTHIHMFPLSFPSCDNVYRTNSPSLLFRGDFSVPSIAHNLPPGGLLVVTSGATRTPIDATSVSLVSNSATRQTILQKFFVLRTLVQEHLGTSAWRLEGALHVMNNYSKTAPHNLVNITITGLEVYQAKPSAAMELGQEYIKTQSLQRNNQAQKQSSLDDCFENTQSCRTKTHTGMKQHSSPVVRSLSFPVISTFGKAPSYASTKKTESSDSGATEMDNRLVLPRSLTARQLDSNKNVLRSYRALTI